jgi:hypothetical protein
MKGMLLIHDASLVSSPNPNRPRCTPMPHTADTSANQKDEYCRVPLAHLNQGLMVPTSLGLLRSSSPTSLF